MTAVGIPWVEQQLGEPPIEIIRRVREDLRSGRFDKREWDHNHPNKKPGRSNKQVKIVGAWLLGYTHGGAVTMDQAWDAVLEMAV